jgi:hypothetical protein
MRLPQVENAKKRKLTARAERQVWESESTENVMTLVSGKTESHNTPYI